MNEKFLVLDVETANSLVDPLVYDVGIAVCDERGNIYQTYSYVISDIFMKDKLMQSAYFKERIPSYMLDLKEGRSEVISLLKLKTELKNLIDKWNIKAVCCYNAGFDIGALNTTLRYLTKSKYKWFLPYGTEVNCIWSMACQVLYTKTDFFQFAIDNNYITRAGNFQTSAEIGYKFITNQINFEEEHKGLADVLIEVQLMAECYKQNQEMNKNINRACWRIPIKKFTETP